MIYVHLSIYTHITMGKTMGIHTYSGYKPVMCEFPWFFPWVFPMKSTQKSKKTSPASRVSCRPVQRPAAPYNPSRSGRGWWPQENLDENLWRV